MDCMFSIKYRTVSDVEKVLLERLENDAFASVDERKQCEMTLDDIPREWEEGTISDLSGGGMRFHSKSELSRGTIIEVMLPLVLQGGMTALKFWMKVIACVHYEGSRIAYEVRGEFKNVKDAQREIVIKYVFEEQRRRMRKE